MYYIASRLKYLRLRQRPCLLIMAFGTAVGVSGCDGSDPVSSTPGRTFPLLSDPDSAIYSLALGLQTRSLNVYLHGISQDFHASFDPEDTMRFRELTGVEPPADWTASDETVFFHDFMGLRPVGYDVRFSSDLAHPDQHGADTAVLFRRYRIWAAQEAIAAGYADLTVIRSGASDEWKVLRWADHKDTSAVTVWTYGMRRLFAAP